MTRMSDTHIHLPEGPWTLLAQVQLGNTTVFLKDPPKKQLEAVSGLKFKSELAPRETKEFPEKDLQDVSTKAPLPADTDKEPDAVDEEVRAAIEQAAHEISGTRDESPEQAGSTGDVDDQDESAGVPASKPKRKWKAAKLDALAPGAMATRLISVGNRNIMVPVDKNEGTLWLHFRLLHVLDKSFPKSDKLVKDPAWQEKLQVKTLLWPPLEHKDTSRSSSRHKQQFVRLDRFHQLAVDVLRRACRRMDSVASDRLAAFVNTVMENARSVQECYRAQVFAEERSKHYLPTGVDHVLFPDSAPILTRVSPDDEGVTITSLWKETGAPVSLPEFKRILHKLKWLIHEQAECDKISDICVSVVRDGYARTYPGRCERKEGTGPVNPADSRVVRNVLRWTPKAVEFLRADQGKVLYETAAELDIVPSVPAPLPVDRPVQRNFDL